MDYKTEITKQEQDSWEGYISIKDTNMNIVENVTVYSMLALLDRFPKGSPRLHREGNL